MESDKQIFSELSIEDQQRLKNQRAVIEKYLGNSENNAHKYKTPAGKLGLIRSLLDQKVFRPDQKYELQCLGIVFGDAISIHLDMRWQMIEDENGIDPCLTLDGTSIVVFPLTMISKRIERGEEVDVFDLFNFLVDEVLEKKKEYQRAP